MTSLSHGEDPEFESQRAHSLLPESRTEAMNMYCSPSGYPGDGPVHSIVVYNPLTRLPFMRIYTALFVSLLMVSIFAAGCTSPGTLPQNQPMATQNTTAMPASGSSVPPEQLAASVESAYVFAPDPGT